MRTVLRRLGLEAFCPPRSIPLLLLTCSLVPAADSPTPPNSIAIEALNRLKGMDIEANPTLKKAVLKVLDTTKGTPQFVEIVRDFNLKDQEPALIEFASKNPDISAGVDAVRLVLASSQTNLLAQSLTRGLVRALGNSAEKQAVPFLRPLLSNTNRELAQETVHALAQTQEGSSFLLEQARADKLAPDLKLLTSSELNAVRWPAIKSEAATLLPLPQSGNAEPLPPIAELMKRKGDPVKGAEVFARPTVGCANCHQVNGKGMDFGPKLSEIGTKLGKDALYVSILDPSAGISFGFEAWQIELKNGDEAYGILASETADEIVIKAQTGILTKIRKTDIAKRQKLATSIMPAGLQQTMSTQDLVDLIEYLSTLKKAN